MEQPVTNDTLRLSPSTVFDGPALEFDFPEFLVGVAEYDAGPTGCTVFVFPSGGRVSADLRGGAVGFVGDYTMVSAICLAGGSLMGLEAAAGVAAEIWAQRGYSRSWLDIPAVSGAIISDFSRSTSIYPDKELGRSAVRAARAGVFPLGARGAGRSATCGKFFTKGEPSGQGGAFLQIGAVKLAVFTVVNSVGAIVGRDSAVVRGNRDASTGERRTPLALVQRRLHRDDCEAPRAGANTTLTVLVTNLQMGPHHLRQLGREVHSSMSRAIQPFHTVSDGDVLYAVSTAEVEDKDRLIDGPLGVLASEVAWDAVLASVPGDAPG
jgi:6-aminohexanoate-oligomer endohydrolase